MLQIPKAIGRSVGNGFGAFRQFRIGRCMIRPQEDVPAAGLAISRCVC